MPESVIYVATNPEYNSIRYWARNAADAERLEKETGYKATRYVAEPGPGVRRIERTSFPNSPAHRALSAFCHAMHGNNIDGADMRAAMLWFLGLEECEEQAAATPITQPAPVAQGNALDAALNDAATSLETIARLAGRTTYGNPPVETCMGTHSEVRSYAASRAFAARAAQEGKNHG